MSYFASAQHPYFRRITTDQGLPSQTVYDIFQDRKGFIWVATENGLARYDGREFKKFSSPNSESLSLTGIKEDEYGNIYTVKFGGQVLKVSSSDSLSLFASFSSQTFNYVGDYCFSGNYLLCCFGQNLYQFDLKTKEIKDIAYLTGDLPMTFSGMIPDNNNGIIFNQNESLYRYQDGKIRKLNFAPELEKQIEKLRPFPHEMRFGKIGNQIIGSFLLINPENTEAHNLIFEIGQDSVRNFRYEISKEFYQTERGLTFNFDMTGEKLFVNSVNGTDYYQLEGKKFVFRQKLFPGLVINKTLFDREGNLWFTSLNNGIFVVPDENIVWLINPKSDIENPKINRMDFYRKKMIAAGFQNGSVLLLNKETGKIEKQLNVSPQNVESIFYSENSDILFIGSGGLLGYDGKSLTPSIVGGSVKDITESENGILYCATNFMSVEIQKNQTKKNPVFIDFKSERIRNMRGFSLVTANKGNELWVAYKDGLMRHINKQNIPIKKLNSDEPFLAASLVRTSDDKIWAGTPQNGIAIFQDGKQIKDLNISTGLSGNEIRIMKERNDTVWVLSNSGFDMITASGSKIEKLSYISSVFSEEIKDFLVDEKFLYLPLNNGLIKIPYMQQSKKITPPEIYISSVRKNGISADFTREKYFDYYERNIDISFTGLSFSSGNLLKYKYRLLGQDTSWTVADYYETKANYLSLAPGDYTFEVKAINSQGIESLQKATFSFSIDQPWWSQVWFISLCFAAAIAGLGIYVRQRENRLLEISAREQEKNKLASELRISQLSAIKAQMNPHFIFNALNSIQNSIFQHDHETANRYLGKFSDLMRMILKMSSEPAVNLEDELKALRLYLDLESVRFKEEFIYAISIDPKIETEWIKIPSMLIQPYVENAIKHGLLHKKTNCRLDIRISIDEKKQVLNVEVDDNGIGRLKSEEIKNRRSKLFPSFATGANQTRLELLNYGKEIFIGCEVIDKINESGEPTGTLVKLRIPVEGEKE